MMFSFYKLGIDGARHFKYPQNLRVVNDMAVCCLRNKKRLEPKVLLAVRKRKLLNEIVSSEETMKDYQKPRT
jgi:hypothetical protein